jgi:hypothetical protein
VTRVLEQPEPWSRPPPRTRTPASPLSPSHPAQTRSAAKLVGLSFDDTALAITALGNAGIKSSDAGTSLKTFLTRLVPLSAQASQEMQRLGIITEDGANRFFDASGNVKSLAEVSDVLGGSLKGMGKEQQIASLQILFGADAIRAAAVIAAEGKTGFDDLSKTLANTSAAEVAATRMGNLKGSIEQLKGSAETLLIQVGTKMLPFLTSAANGATQFVNALSSGNGAGWLGAVFDAVQRLRPAWGDLVSTGQNLWQVFGAVVDAAKPIVSLLGQLWAAAQIAQITAAAEILQRITGFLADNEGLIRLTVAGVAAFAALQAWALIVSAVETIYVQWLILQGAVGGSAILNGLGMVATGFMTMGTNATLGAGMVRGGMATVASSAGLARIAMGGLIAVGVLGFMEWQRAGEKAAKKLDDLKPKDFNEGSLTSLRRYSEILGHTVSASTDAAKGTDGFMGATKALVDVMPVLNNGTIGLIRDQEKAGQAFENNTAQISALASVYQATWEKMSGQKIEPGKHLALDSSAFKEIDAWIQKLNLDPAKQTASEMAGAIGKASAAASTGSPMVDTLSAAYTTLADKTSSATDRVKAWKDAIDQAIGVQLSIFDSTTKFEQSVDDLTMKLATNAKAGLDQNTTAGRENASALSGAAQAAIDLATAQANGVGGMEAGNAALAANRDRIIEAGVAAGVSRGQMNAYLDQLGLTPQNLATLVTLQGTDAAKAQLDGLTQEQRVAQVIAKAVTDNADIDLATAAGRLRIATIVADAITGQAEFGLAGVTDKGRVATIIAQALASGADIDLNTVTGRQRLARIVAQADLGAAPGQLDGAAHGRNAPIVADAQTAKAKADLDYLTQARNIEITANIKSAVNSVFDQYGVVHNRHGGLYSFAGGGVTPAHVAMGTRYKWAEPETGGEAFVPKKGNKDRSLSILATAAAWYGSKVVPMARGGVVAQPVGYMTQADANAMYAGSVDDHVGPDRAELFATRSSLADAMAQSMSTMPAWSSSGSGGRAPVSITGPTTNITVNGSGEKAIADIVEAKVLPVIARYPDQVAKILVQRAAAVGR